MLKYCIYFIVLSIILQACAELPNNISVPEWDTDFNIPVAKRIYSVDSILSKTKYIVKNNNSQLDYLICLDTLKKDIAITDFLNDKLNFSYSNLSANISQGSGSIYLPFPNGCEIDSAFFFTGYLSVQIFNNSNDNAQAKFILPDFKDIFGNPITEYCEIGANSNYNVKINLSSIAYSAKNRPDKSHFIANFEINTIQNSDNLIFNTSLTNSSLAYIEGILPPTDLENASTSISLSLDNELKQMRNKFKLFSPNLNLNIYYQAKHDTPFEVLLSNIHFNGINKDNSSLTLTENGNPNLSSILMSSKNTSTDYNESNSNISDLISFLPDKINLDSKVTINPNQKSGIAQYDDSIKIKAQITALNQISAENIALSDTFNLDIKNNIRDEIKYGRNINLEFQVSNGLPVSANVNATFLDANFTPLFSKIINISPSQVNESGISISSTDNTFAIPLDSNEIADLASAYHVITSMSASTTNNNKVIIRSCDLLKLNVKASVKYHVQISR